MNKNFEKELIALINKHGMEKEFGDTPDFILAKVAIVSMMNFSAATQERDKWHGFKKADRPKPENFKFPEDCKKCEKRFKCISFLLQEPISTLTERLQQTDDKEEINTIALAIQERQNDKPDDISNISKALKDGFAFVMLHGWDKSEKKPTFKNNRKKAPKEDKPTIQENDADLDKIVSDALNELNKRGKVIRLVFKDKKDGREHTYLPKEESENEQK